MNPEIKEIDNFVKVDFKIPGCPISGEKFLKFSKDLIKGKIPEICQTSVCVECPRRGTSNCFLAQKKICLGLITLAGCKAICPKNEFPRLGCRGIFKGANVKGFLRVLESFQKKEEVEENLEIFGIKDDIEKILKKMKITIPHIHKMEREAGFWAKVTKEGKIEELKLKTLLGLRQIEGILIGRRFQEVPIVVSRICGICPIVHILNACSALEKALNIKVSRQTVLLRKLMLANQIIQSHTLHLFFMSLPDFFDIENDLDLMKKFPKEAKAALKIRDFSLKVIKVIGGRAVHPITPIVGGFSKFPEKKEILNL